MDSKLFLPCGPVMKSIAAIPAESIPFIGAAVLIAEIGMSCMRLV
jgi:hypothetical protein